MICDKIEKYIRDVLCARDFVFTPEMIAKHEALRDEVEKLAGHIFIRQFLTKEEPSEKGKLRLSACGHCPRQQAYAYHGFPKAGKEIDKRAKTVFFMGDLVELLIIALARLAGCDIQNYGLAQLEIGLKVAENGHTVIGHPDGFLVQDGKKYLLECKSMASYAYERFEKGEVDESYRWQINAYLEATGLDTCCLIAINKDNGVMTEQIVKQDSVILSQIRKVLAAVLSSTPEKLPEPQFKPDDKGILGWQCRYCGYWRTCWPEAEEILVKNSYKLRVKKD